MTSYAAFLERKDSTKAASGFSEIPELSPMLKPFQKAIVEWALRRGKAAIFANTGLGKTPMQLSWARAVADRYGKVLLLCPLAVAEQTCEEAEKFNIPGVGLGGDSLLFSKHDISVINYEKFNDIMLQQYAGIVLDESGLIKHEDGKTRKLLTEACANLKWKLCCTATPAPNDYTELGQHAEFLDVMTSKEMLAMYFVHEGSIRADGSKPEWRLKRHGEQAFWRWLASWSVVVRSPEDSVCRRSNCIR
jgi:hypothetical protein